ncbi:MAG: YrdB family protein [Anaerolineae bacterium]|nr:YrdB family protein [Anaerolineae bacterium]
MLPSANLALSFLLELVALVALGYWGFQASDNTLLKFILGLGAPILLIVVWGMWLAPKSSRRLRRPWLQIVKLLVFGVTALALANAGQTTLAVIFAVVVIINAALAEIWKQE